MKSNVTPVLTYEEELEVLQQAFNKRVTALANKVRRELIMPACKKHGLKFYSGMGTFFFSKDGATITPDVLRISDRLATKISGLLDKFNLHPIFEVLNLEVNRNQCLGYYVSDYIPPALKKPIA